MSGDLTFTYDLDVVVEDEHIEQGVCPACANALSVRSRIVLALRCASRPCSAREVAVEVDVPSPSVRRTLGQLIRDRLVIPTQDPETRRHLYAWRGDA